jgi:type IV secretion system protein VirD4
MEAIRPEWIIYAVMIIVALVLLCWRFGSNSTITHGAAAWCRVFTAFRKGLFKRRGLYVGDWTGRLAVHYQGAHAITFGQSGCGKGTSAILPNLLTARRAFVVDPGGENTATAIKAWRKDRLEIACINPFAMHTAKPWALPIHGFNPLALLDPNSASFAADALLLAEMLTPRSGKESGNAHCFKQAAASAKRAMLIHIKTAEPAGRQNIGTLYEYAYGGVAAWNALLRAMKANPASGHLAKFEAEKLSRIETQAPEEFSAIMSTIQQDLAFLADPLVRQNLSRNDVDFLRLKTGGKRAPGCIISVVMPLAYIESHAAITRLAMACAILILERQPYAPEPVTFLIDEAAALGKIARLPNWLATLRKYNVRIWTIWQNIGQVVELYGANWQTIVSNCALMQILGVSDLQTAQYTQAMIGQSTVSTESVNAKGERSVSQTARPLVMADELLRTADDEQIVLLGNLWPMKLKKVPYWDRPELKGRYHPGPFYHGRMPRRSPHSGISAFWGRLYYALVSLMAPHPLVALILTGLLLIAGLPYLQEAGLIGGAR